MNSLKKSSNSSVSSDSSESPKSPRVSRRTIRKAPISSEYMYFVELFYLMENFPDTCIVMPFEFPFSEEEYESLSSGAMKGGSSIFWGILSEKEHLSLPFKMRLEEYKELLTDCTNNSTRFTIIPLTLYTEKNAHANMIIYDKINKTAERFEPHGSVTLSRYNPEQLDKYLAEVFQFIYGDDVKYFPPNAFCPKYGAQGQGSFGEILTVDREMIHPGYCMVWAFIYVNYRLMFPDKSANELARKMIDISSSKNYYFVEKIARNLADLSEKLRKTPNMKTTRKYAIQTAERIKPEIQLKTGSIFDKELMDEYFKGIKESLKNLKKDEDVEMSDIESIDTEMTDV